MKKESSHLIDDPLLRRRKQIVRNRFILLGVLLFVLLLCAFLSLLVDNHGLSFADEFLAIFGQGSNEANVIIRNIRGRRVLSAIIVGMGLSASGAVMQSTLKNPMASPSTLGVSESATFGATLAILFLSGGALSSSGISISSPYAVTGFAFLFSILTILIILALSKIKGFAPEIVALSGVALGMLFQALTNLVQYFASDTTLASAVYWTFGDLTRATYEQIYILMAVIFPCLLVFLLLSPKLNAIEEGEETAKSLGVNVGAVRFIGLLLASLITAVSVSFVGIIGFIGLVIPQVMKRLIGADNRYLIPVSSLVGGSALLICDLLSRVLLSGTNLPVGALTAIIGAPIFIYILLTNRRRNG